MQRTNIIITKNEYHEQPPSKKVISKETAMRGNCDFRKLISHFDMNVFPRLVWILSLLTAFVLKLLQKIIDGQKSTYVIENCHNTSIFND